MRGRPFTRKPSSDRNLLDDPRGTGDPGRLPAGTLRMGVRLDLRELLA